MCVVACPCAFMFACKYLGNLVAATVCVGRCTSYMKSKTNRGIIRHSAHSKHGERFEAESYPLLFVSYRYQAHDLVFSILAAGRESCISATQKFFKDERARHHMQVIESHDSREDIEMGLSLCAILGTVADRCQVKREHREKYRRCSHVGASGTG
jgi:hypothetical protein